MLIQIIDISFICRKCICFSVQFYKPKWMNIAVTISTVTHRAFHDIAKFPLLFYNQTLPSHPERKWKWKLLSRVWLFVTPSTYTVCGILQARILEWIAFPFSRGSSQPRDGTQGSLIAGGFFTSWATKEDKEYWSR